MGGHYHDLLYRRDDVYQVFKEGGEMTIKMSKTLTEQYRGQIPVGVKYDLKDVIYGKGIESFDYESCQNCGNAISNIFIIENEAKEKYRVGSECVKALCEKSLTLSEDMRKMQRRLRFCRWFSKSNPFVLLQGDYVWIYEKPVTEWHSFWKYQMAWATLKSFLPMVQPNLILEKEN